MPEQKLVVPACPRRASGYLWRFDRERSTTDCQADVCQACGLVRLTSYRTGQVVRYADSGAATAYQYHAMDSTARNYAPPQRSRQQDLLPRSSGAGQDAVPAVSRRAGGSGAGEAAGEAAERARRANLSQWTDGRFDAKTDS